MLQQSFNTIAKWGKFLGYYQIIMGVLLIITALVPALIVAFLGGADIAIGIGLSLFVIAIGLVCGLVFIKIGLYILRSAKEASVLVDGLNEGSLEGMFLNYAKFLKLNGVLMIIGVVFYAISLILTFSTFATAFFI